MEIKIEKQKKNLKMEIKEEDLSIGQIVRRELLKNPDTAFAGVVKPHPLLKKFVINLQTKRRNPVQVLVDGSKSAMKQSMELTKKVESALISK